MERELTIREVAESTGLSVHTLRYYERAGLLPAVARNGGGHRRYRPMDVDLLLFLSLLRAMGMPIHRVRQYAELGRRGPSTIPERKALLEEHRREVRAQIETLQKNLGCLDYKIELYEQGWVPSLNVDDPQSGQLREMCYPQSSQPAPPDAG